MPRHTQRQTKASVKHLGQEHWPVPLKYGLYGLVPLLIAAWMLWRTARRRRATKTTWRPRPRKAISESGYVEVEGELEHRLIAERVLGRKLITGEVVHHINGIKTDNRESNLCVMNSTAHNDFHDWLTWKRNKEGYYPPKKYQRAVLRDRFAGILLVTYPSDLPPLDPDSDPEPDRNAS